MNNSTEIQIILYNRNAVLSERFEEDWDLLYSYELASLIVVCVVLGFIILGTILGNIFVISAILLEKSLRATSNYLILSLAVTDLMVAVLVMPISILNEISVSWRLGSPVCDMWISFDLLCCTASILHLVAIALDRYWSVTNVDYTRHRSAGKILLMILIVWCVSFAISVPPLLGWRDTVHAPEKTGYCLISQDPGYTVFSTLGAFYIPLMLILALNLKIYRVARKRFKKRSVLRAALQVQRASVTMLVGTGSYIPAQSQVETCRSDVKMINTSVYDERTTVSAPGGNLLTVPGPNPNLLSPPSSKVKADPPSLNIQVDPPSFNIQVDPPSCQLPGGPACQIQIDPPSCNLNRDPHVCDIEIDPPSFQIQVDPPSCNIQVDAPSFHIQVDPPSCKIQPDAVSCNIQPEAHSLLKPSCSSLPAQSTLDIDGPETTYDNGYTPITKAASSGGKKLDKFRRFTVPEIKKEKRTASVLGIITGAFILCWLPFFIVALIRPFCQRECVFPGLMMSLFVWLGYVNSMINPIIYTVFNPNFRLAFRKLLCGRLRLPGNKPQPVKQR